MSLSITQKDAQGFLEGARRRFLPRAAELFAESFGLPVRDAPEDRELGRDDVVFALPETHAPRGVPLLERVAERFELPRRLGLALFPFETANSLQRGVEVDGLAVFALGVARDRDRF